MNDRSVALPPGGPADSPDESVPRGAVRSRRGPPVRFLVVALALIGALHAYVGIRLVPDLELGRTATVAAICWLVASTLLMPVGLLARLLTAGWGDRGATVAAWTGAITSGFASSLLVLTAARDVLLLIGFAVLPDAALGAVIHDSAWGVAGLALAFTVVGFANARRTPAVVRVDIPVRDLPPGLEGLSIAQISDIHVGSTIKRGFVDRVVDRVNSLESDLVAITGDLVDGSVADLAEHTRPLERLRARYGVYFVTGNHEYYSGAAPWVAELRTLGVQVLMNEHVVLNHGDHRVVVAGVTDYSAHQFDELERSDPAAALSGAPSDAGVRILLAHQPRTAPAAEAAGFDVQLSGHTHGGQFFPWNYFVRLQQPFTAGLHRLGRLAIYTSRGTGYWGPPKRLGAAAEITLLRLRAV